MMGNTLLHRARRDAGHRSAADFARAAEPDGDGATYEPIAGTSDTIEPFGGFAWNPADGLLVGDEFDDERWYGPVA